MQEGSILELDLVEKDFKVEKKAGAVSRLLLFLPKLILTTLIVCLIMFLANLVYCLVRYCLTGEILYFLPEASQVLYFARSSTGLLAMGTVLAITLSVFVLYVSFQKKNKILIDKQVNNAEDSMFQTMIEIVEGETPAQVVTLPVEKKAPKKIYGRYCEQEDTKKEEKFRKKNKPNNKHRGSDPDYNPEQRGNVVIFKQKHPPFLRRAYRPVTSRVNINADRIKRSAQKQNGK